MSLPHSQPNCPIPLPDLETDRDESKDPFHELNSLISNRFSRTDSNPFPVIHSDTLRQGIKTIPSSNFDTLIIINARFDYEYAGGHILNSMNAQSVGQVKTLFDQ
jgi:hypothetical protein